MGIFDWLSGLFGGRSEASSEVDEELAQQWYDHKSALLEKALGKEHDMVMHAIIRPLLR